MDRFASDATRFRLCKCNWVDYVDVSVSVLVYLNINVKSDVAKSLMSLHRSLCFSVGAKAFTPRILKVSIFYCTLVGLGVINLHSMHIINIVFIILDGSSLV